MPDSSQADRWQSCDDDQEDSVGDGTHTVMPLFLAGTAGQPIIIENFPGESVVIDGTNSRITVDNWISCAAETYVRSDLNVGSARTPQIWIDPANPADPGTRLAWNADASGSCVLERGEFSVRDGGREIYVRLPDGSDPNSHEIKLSCQNGDCAAHPIAANTGAEHLIVRRNADGGSFHVKYGYYNGYITGSANNILFDGVDWVAAGGRDYGHCVRVIDGNDITIANGSCREAMGEGIALYGGGARDGLQTARNTVENMDVSDTGRGWVDGGGAGNSLGMGVILKNCRDCVVRGSTIRGSYRSGIQVNHSTAGCPSAACDSSNALIERNLIWDFCRLRQGDDPNAQQTDCGAILLRADGTNGFINGGTIRNNMVHGRVDTPVSIPGAPSGIYTDGDIPNVVIENNSLNLVPGACINVDPNPNPVLISGNAMDGCSVTNTGCNGQECALFGDATTPHITQYNTYWAGTDTTQVVRRNMGVGHTRATVAGNFEATAIQEDPQFLSASDLRLQPDSALIDAMPCNVAPAVDIFGTARPQGGDCDVGAHEQ